MDSDEDARRKNEWLEKMKREGKLTRNPTEDHKFGLKVLQNTVRREILISLKDEKKSYEEIKEKFNLNDHMANFHLNMLEDALYIEKKEEEGKIFYFPTLRGEGYLENVEMKK
jgi:predicted transcriptional regulator